MIDRRNPPRTFEDRLSNAVKGVAGLDYQPLEFSPGDLGDMAMELLEKHRTGVNKEDNRMRSYNGSE